MMAADAIDVAEANTTPTNTFDTFRVFKLFYFLKDYL